MKKLKIIFNTSPGAFENPGGGEVQLLKTKQGLEQQGHEVKILEKEDYALDFDDFDVFHNFNIHRDNFEQIKRAKQAGLPVAISTIYWHSPGRKIASGAGLKTIAVELINIFGPRLSRVAKIVSMADVLMPNSRAEAEQLRNIFGAGDERIRVVPNGVEERFKSAKPGPFEKKYGLKDFVLYVGRIEERKNVLGLVKAMRNADEKLVIIGDAKSGSDAYYKKCKAEADAEKTLFLPAMPHESKLFESAYAACGVFCLPSWYETPGLAALEAGLAGASIVITEEGCTREYFGNLVSYVNPKSVVDIRNKIRGALCIEKSKELSRHVAGNFLWENTVLETSKAYYEVAGK